MASNSDVPVSPVNTSRPELTLSAAAINNEPIELDATPISFEQVRMSRRSSKAFALDAFEAEREAASVEQERRERLISERKDDPAVVVDVPQQPGADELEQSGAGGGGDDNNHQTVTGTSSHGSTS